MRMVLGATVNALRSLGYLTAHGKARDLAGGQRLGHSKASGCPQNAHKGGGGFEGHSLTKIYGYFGKFPIFSNKLSYLAAFQTLL